MKIHDLSLILSLVLPAVYCFIDIYCLLYMSFFSFFLIFFQYLAFPMYYFFQFSTLLSRFWIWYSKVIFLVLDMYILWQISVFSYVSFTNNNSIRRQLNTYITFFHTNVGCENLNLHFKKKKLRISIIVQFIVHIHYVLFFKKLYFVLYFIVIIHATYHSIFFSFFELI